MTRGYVVSGRDNQPEPWHVDWDSDGLWHQAREEEDPENLIPTDWEGHEQ